MPGASPNHLRAAAYMLGAVLSFTLMAVAGRQIGHAHDTFEILAYRSLAGLAMVGIFAWAAGRLGQISTRHLPGHLLRNTVHFTGQNLWFAALLLAPLAQVFALEFTAPIWVILLAPLFLGEALTRGRLAAVGFGFLGILIVTRPFTAGLSWGVLAAAGSALCFATTSILTKRLTRAEPVLAILFWLTAMQSVFGLIAAGFDGVMRLPTLATLPWLLVIAVTGVVAHLSLTSALRLAPASFVTPVDFLRLPLIAVVGALFYGEALDFYVLIGGAVILAGIWLNLRSTAVRKATNPEITSP